MSVENSSLPTLPKNNPNWQKLLVDAVQQPGRISAAYSAFHNYSIGNALEALWQCTLRGIEPGPITTFPGWKQLGRHVRKGEKAISLWMPVTCKGKRRNSETGEETDYTFTRFIYKPHWFVVSQTDGKEVEYPQVPGFDLESALITLKISRVAFDITDGNYHFSRSCPCSPGAHGRITPQRRRHDTSKYPGSRGRISRTDLL